MERKHGPLFFIGAMPPPLHGMSNVNARMFAALSRRDINIHLFDIARHRNNTTAAATTNSERVIHHIFRFVSLMAFARGKKKTYLSLSGGFGQFRDLAFIVISRVFRAKIYIHHHSFAYLNKRKAITLLCVWAAGPRSDHIVLCERMAVLLSKQYQTRPNRISCLSNAAFLSSEERGMGRRQLRTVSFLSNITFEKGISTFFEVAGELKARKVPVRFMIAGPVALDVKGWLDLALAAAPEVQYVGPQYGLEKTRFFSQTDLLVFPSTYPNEAEPVTILEAFSFGVPVIATALGCIPSLVSDERGFVVPAQARLPLTIAGLIQQLIEDEITYRRLSENCNTYFESNTSGHLSALKRIVDSIECGRDFEGKT
ncbi:glycosyl transferase, group 1 [Caballeronia arvi]|uniref:Glycosyl transferase, group 1 n=1 Tax=Caballeronia arvi TaxID=1777135 RepID=A0A158L094_9BURK|nr:glycosyltransferase family 4 protein [Caballeronia arvi]SAL86429.1 glycosyl transferase, group 1 [Caballeronia arvi]